MVLTHSMATNNSQGDEPRTIALKRLVQTLVTAGLCLYMDKVMSGFPTGIEGLIWNSWFNYIFLQDIHTNINLIVHAYFT